jgi:DNA invertase Pin-like site-specific DNA recombinase
LLLNSRKHKAVLVIAKLDRLARNVAFISALMETKGVEFIACDFPKANRLTIHIMAAVAEHEAEAISLRTKAALQAAKARGVKLGGTAEGAAKGTANWVAQAAERKAGYAPVIADIQAKGISSFKGIARELNLRGVKTPRGGQWTATQVSRAMA